MKKILITGGAGFIGFHLARYLAENKYQVDLLDNFSRGVIDSELEELSNRSNARLISLDLSEGNLGEKLENDYDVIAHLAAIIGVSNVIKRPYDVLRDNVTMLVNLLDFAKTQKKLKRFIFTSTSEVYAGTLTYFDLPIPTPEDTPLAVTDIQHPRTSYMLSKIYGESLCQQAGIVFTIFRPHNIYGPRMGLSHVIPELLKKAYESEDRLEVFSPDHTRTFCFIEDAVKMIALAADSKNCENKTLNLGVQSPEITIRDLAGTILKLVGRNLTLNVQPPTPGSPIRRCPDMSEMSRLVGFQPDVKLEQGLKMTYDWYRKNIFEGNEVGAK